MPSRNPVYRLLRRNISIPQIAGYALANLVGLAIVLTAIQFYRDVTSVASAEDSFVSSDYLIISKKVKGLGGFMGSTPADTRFTPAEIADISSQPWAAGTGEFTAADFNVAASIDMGGASFSTALFLESIPDEYFDVKPRGWKFRPGQPVPVIISKDYLTLYNFGFATSRGLPQLSEELIGAVPLRLSLSGGGRQEWVDARIAGFSSRLNTIAVPGEFMEWANARFGEPGSAQEDPSRIIIHLRRAGDPEAMAYMDAHGYEIAGDKDAGGKTSYFLSIITGVVITVGIVISLLAFFILLLSIYLLLQKNRAKIHDLMMLGYTPGQISAYYYRLVGGVNLIVLLLGISVMLYASSRWQTPLATLGAEGSSVWPTIATGVILILLITAGNLLAITRSVRKTFRY